MNGKRSSNDGFQYKPVSRHMQCVGVGKVHPNLAEREAAYYEALRLVAVIDSSLGQSCFHIQDCTGETLFHLDEVINAILAGEWPVDLPDDPAFLEFLRTQASPELRVFYGVDGDEVKESLSE